MKAISKARDNTPIVNVVLNWGKWKTFILQRKKAKVPVTVCITHLRVRKFPFPWLVSQATSPDDYVYTIKPSSTKQSGFVQRILETVIETRIIPSQETTTWRIVAVDQQLLLFTKPMPMSLETKSNFMQISKAQTHKDYEKAGKLTKLVFVSYLNWMLYPAPVLPVIVHAISNNPLFNHSLLEGIPVDSLETLMFLVFKWKVIGWRESPGVPQSHQEALCWHIFCTTKTCLESRG